jgi:hypothetical protein
LPASHRQHADAFKHGTFIYGGAASTNKALGLVDHTVSDREN